MSSGSGGGKTGETERRGGLGGVKRKHETGPAKEGLQQMAHELTHDVEA